MTTPRHRAGLGVRSDRSAVALALKSTFTSVVTVPHPACCSRSCCCGPGASWRAASLENVQGQIRTVRVRGLPDPRDMQRGATRAEAHWPRTRRMGEMHR